MSDISPVELQKYLAGVDYPAGRDQLVEAARANNADEDALAALQKLPDREYEGPSGVSKELFGD